MIARRSLLLGLGATLAAPALIRTPGLLMPVRIIARTPVTIHVSGGYPGLDSDGSAARPFRTLQVGFKAADAMARLGRNPTVQVAPWHIEYLREPLFMPSAVQVECRTHDT